MIYWNVIMYIKKIENYVHHMLAIPNEKTATSKTCVPVEFSIRLREISDFSVGTYVHNITYVALVEDIHWHRFELSRWWLPSRLVQRLGEAERCLLLMMLCWCYEHNDERQIVWRMWVEIYPCRCLTINHINNRYEVRVTLLV